MSDSPDLRLTVGGGEHLDGDTHLVDSPARDTASPVAPASPVMPASPPRGQVPARAAPPAAPAKPREYSADEHLLSLAELSERFGTKLNLSSLADSPGLGPAEVAAAQRAHGRNVLTPPKEKSELLKFLLQFTDGFMLLLMVAGFLCFLAQAFSPPSDSTNAILGGTLFVVVFLTCVMNYAQDRATSSVMAQFKGMIAQDCLVVRGGVEARIPSSELVPGDLVKLKLGNRVPADLRLLAQQELKVECSSLTGEPDAIACATTAAHADVREARNVVFNSSLVMNGSGLGLVVKTGDKTLIGKVASLASGIAAVDSSMQREVKLFVHIIAKLALLSAVVLFVIGVARNHTKAGIVNAFVNGFIVVLVANVPEGLPATVVSCLTISAKRMAGVHVFIKKSDIIETLGATTVIASDKTGTLTQNRMTVANTWQCGGGAKAQTGAGGGGDDGGGGGGTLIIRSLSAFRGVPSERVRMTQVAHLQRQATYKNVRNAGAAPPPLPVLGAQHPPLMGLPALDPIARTALGRQAQFKSGEQGAGRLECAMAPADGMEGGPEGAAVAAPGAAAAAVIGVGVSLAGGHVTSQKSLLLARQDSVRRFAPPQSPALDLPLQPPHGAAASSRSLPAAGFASLSPTGRPRFCWFLCDPAFRLALIAGINNSAYFLPPPEGAPAAGALPPAAVKALRGERAVEGDASEAALLRWVDGAVAAAGGGIETLRGGFEKLHVVPFNSVNKWSLTVVADGDAAGGHLALLKGAPEVVITHCTHYLSAGGGEALIDAAFRKEWQDAYEAFGFAGERVLGFAYAAFAAPPGGAAAYAAPGGADAISKQDFVFAGLVSLVDPPREGVAAAVARCRTASIRVTMVTGDHSITAEAIARKVGIITLPTAREVNAAVAEGGAGGGPVGDELRDSRVHAVVRTGAELRAMCEADWDAMLRKEEVVFARTTPEQKLEIVEHYQRLGHVVAVTGDGVNDSPALKRANVGVAMGGPGASDVAREAADIILMDNNFASIVGAIEEGRTLFDNLKKSIAYTLAHLWPELLPVFLNLALDMPLALPGLPILVIDLLTEQGPAISFSSEKAEAAVMLLPPRDVARDRLVSRSLLQYAYILTGLPSMLTCMFAFFMTFAIAGVPVASLVGTSATYWQAGAPDFSVGGRVLSAAAQLDLYHQAVAAYFSTLILNQFWNVWVCKTRHTSIFTHGVLDNSITLFGVAVEILIMVLVVFLPGLQGIMFTASFPSAVWACHLVFAAYVVAMSEAVKAATRRDPTGWVARNLAY